MHLILFLHILSYNKIGGDRVTTKKMIAVVTTIVVVVALIVGGVFFYQSTSTNKKMDAFENTVNTLKDLRLQYSPGSFNALYETLVDECNTCLANKDTESISSLTDRIKELKVNIISENKQLTVYKAQLTYFQNAVSTYVITGASKTEYQRLLSEFETAIERCDVSLCNTIAKQISTFLSKQKTQSEVEVENQKNKKDSGNTQIYITPQTETKPQTIQKKEPSVIYVRPSNPDFICPDSSIRYLTDSDLRGLTKTELKYARNEIFARHGRKFGSKELQSYFNSKAWYYGYIEPNDFDDEVLSKIENANVELIQKYEKR